MQPSPGWQRFQVVSVLSVAWFYLKYYPSPPTQFLQRINRRLAETQPWKIVGGTMAAGYLLKNFFLLCFLNAPEPLAKMYTRNFYRATWVLTALDAGFLTAMNIRPALLRNILSCMFSLFYLVFPEEADEKVRKYRAVATYQMMRVSWDKAKNPILRVISFPFRGFLSIRENISFARPNDPPSKSSFPLNTLGPIKARLYFKGSRQELMRADRLIFHIPGGGFVCMSPICHDDYVSTWAKQTGVPILSIDYGKAPEHPYPFALEEVFDAYRAVVQSNGQVLGLDGWTCSTTGAPKPPIKVIVTGDSAGGNISTGLILRILESSQTFPRLTVPAGLMLLYPCLSMEMGCWMPPSQMSLLRAESVKSLPSLLQAKEYHVVDKRDSPLTVPVAPRGIDILKNKVDRGDGGFLRSLFGGSGGVGSKAKNQNAYNSLSSLYLDQQENIIRTSLSMTSRMSYFQDRLLAPEMMRAMAIMYLNGSPIPYSVHDDIYLNPVMASNELLANFPPTFFLTGEKDPLVDDTVVFAARLRMAKMRRAKRMQGGYGTRRSYSGQHTIPRTAIDISDAEDEEEHYGIRVRILEGMSHAFFNMMAFLPEAAQATTLTSRWFKDLFEINISANVDNYKMDKNDVNISIPSAAGIEGAAPSAASKSTTTSTASTQSEASKLDTQLHVVSEQTLMQRRRNDLSSLHLT